MAKSASECSRVWLVVAVLGTVPSGCVYGLSIAPAGHVVFHEVTSNTAAAPETEPRDANVAALEVDAARAADDAADDAASNAQDTVGPPASAPPNATAEIPGTTVQGSVVAGVGPLLATSGSESRDPEAALGVLGEYGYQLGRSARGKTRGELVVDGVFGSSVRRGGPDENGWNAVLRVGWRAQIHRRVTLGAGLNTAYQSLYAYAPGGIRLDSTSLYTSTSLYNALGLVPDFEVATGGGRGRYEWSVVERVGPRFNLYPSPSVEGQIFSMTSFNQALVLGPRRRVLFPLGLSTIVYPSVSDVAAEFIVFGGVGFMGSLH